MVLDSKEITDDVNLATIPSWCPLPDAPPEQDKLKTLWQFCLDNGIEVQDDLIGCPGNDGFLLLRLVKKIAELRKAKP